MTYKDRTVRRLISEVLRVANAGSLTLVDVKFARGREERRNCQNQSRPALARKHSVISCPCAAKKSDDLLKANVIHALVQAEDAPQSRSRQLNPNYYGTFGVTKFTILASLLRVPLEGR
jgi:hypothetical protein